jgi:SAM-dependent methyltransferase
MTNQNPDIVVWEDIEIKRSKSEASRRSEDDLRISSAIIDRYLDPPADTNFPLEYAYHLLGDATGKKVLDYGCGAGENSVLIASHGGSPIGVDISPELIGLAESRMEICGMHDYEFKVGSAHELPIEDGSIDVVFGMAILHHLDLELASSEVFRVLKKGGRAIFFEPVRNSPLIWFVRGLIPYTAPDVSPYERPLRNSELDQFSRRFSLGQSRSFSLPFVNLIEVLGLDFLLHPAIAVDGAIIKSLPFLGRYGSIKVFEIVK